MNEVKCLSSYNTIIVLLDVNSKKMIKKSFDDVIQRNMVVISDFSEINSDLVNATNKLVIFEGILETPYFYENINVYSNIYNLDIVYIGKRFDTASLLKIRVFPYDISLLDSSIIIAAVNNDSFVKGDDELVHSMCDDMVSEIMSGGSIDRAKITSNFLFLYNTYKRILEDNKFLIQACSEKNLLIETLRGERDKYVDGYKKIFKETIDMNNKLDHLQDVLTRDICEKIDISQYRRRPNIIYIKEYIEIYEQDLFIETLFDVFRLQRQMSVKVLRLHDGKGSRRAMVLPDYYYKIKKKYLECDIIENDFISMCGDYTGILDLLLNNNVELDVLIVVDCKSSMDTIFIGNVMNINLCRYKDYMATFSISAVNTVCCDGDLNMLWDIQRKDKEGGRFLELSSKGVFGSILKIYDLFNTEKGGIE